MANLGENPNFSSLPKEERGLEEDRWAEVGYIFSVLPGKRNPVEIGIDKLWEELEDPGPKLKNVLKGSSYLDLLLKPRKFKSQFYAMDRNNEEIVRKIEFHRWYRKWKTCSESVTVPSLRPPAHHRALLYNTGETSLKKKFQERLLIPRKKRNEDSLALLTANHEKDLLSEINVINDRLKNSSLNRCPTGRLPGLEASAEGQRLLQKLEESNKKRIKQKRRAGERCWEEWISNKRPGTAPSNSLPEKPKEKTLQRDPKREKLAEESFRKWLREKAEEHRRKEKLIIEEKQKLNEKMRETEAEKNIRLEKLKTKIRRQKVEQRKSDRKHYYVQKTRNRKSLTDNLREESKNEGVAQSKIKNLRSSASTPALQSDKHIAKSSKLLKTPYEIKLTKRNQTLEVEEDLDCSSRYRKRKIGKAMTRVYNWMRSVNTTKLILKFKSLDDEKTGLVGISDFMRILAISGLKLGAEEASLIFEKYADDEIKMVRYKRTILNMKNEAESRREKFSAQAREENSQRGDMECIYKLRKKLGPFRELLRSILQHESSIVEPNMDFPTKAWKVFQSVLENQTNITQEEVQKACQIFMNENEEYKNNDFSTLSFLNWLKIPDIEIKNDSKAKIVTDDIRDCLRLLFRSFTEGSSESAPRDTILKFMQQMQVASTNESTKVKTFSRFLKGTIWLELMMKGIALEKIFFPAQKTVHEDEFIAFWIDQHQRSLLRASIVPSSPIESPIESSMNAQPLRYTEDDNIITQKKRYDVRPHTAGKLGISKIPLIKLSKLEKRQKKKRKLFVQKAYGLPGNMRQKSDQKDSHTPYKQMDTLQIMLCETLDKLTGVSSKEVTDFIESEKWNTLPIMKLLGCFCILCKQKPTNNTAIWLFQNWNETLKKLKSDEFLDSWRHVEREKISFVLDLTKHHQINYFLPDSDMKFRNIVCCLFNYVKAYCSCATANVSSSTTNEKPSEKRKDGEEKKNVMEQNLSKAKRILNVLKPTDVAEIKSLAKPPDCVKKTFGAVNILLNEKPDWESVKRKTLTDGFLIQILKDLDIEKIPKCISKRFRKYVSDHDLEIERVRRAGRVAGVFCKWIHAVNVIMNEIFSSEKEAIEDIKEPMKASQSNQKVITSDEGNVAQEKECIEKSNIDSTVNGAAIDTKAQIMVNGITESCTDQKNGPNNEQNKVSSQAGPQLIKASSDLVEQITTSDETPNEKEEVSVETEPKNISETGKNNEEPVLQEKNEMDSKNIHEMTDSHEVTVLENRNETEKGIKSNEELVLQEQNEMDSKNIPEITDSPEVPELENRDKPEEGTKNKEELVLQKQDETDSRHIHEITDNPEVPVLENRDKPEKGRDSPNKNEPGDAEKPVA